MAAALDTLPAELAVQILSYLSKPDWLALRLVSPRLVPLATKYAFSHLSISACHPYYHDDGQHRGEDNVRKFAAIRANPHHRKCVKKLTIDIRPLDEWSIEESSLGRQYFKAAFVEAGHCENISHVVINFTYGSTAQGSTVIDFLNFKRKQEYGFRYLLFATSISILKGPNHPPHKITALKINDLPALDYERVISGQPFISLMTDLRDLRIRVNNETYTKEDAAHTFYHQLSRSWLTPATNLTTLYLVGTYLWGYCPRVDLRGIRFASLSTLGLSCYCFSHEWQLDWILEHTSLQHLFLINCPIVTYQGASIACDAEGYVLNAVGAFTTYQTRIIFEQRYHTTWARYFQRIGASLTNLTLFYTCPFGDYGWYNKPISEVEDIESNLSDERYVVFDIGMRTLWAKSSSADVKPMNFTQGPHAHLDQGALKTLVGIVRARSRGPVETRD